MLANDDNQNNVPEVSSDTLDGVNSLKVDNFYYSPNSLTELRKIAEVDPELAGKIVDSQTKAVRWFNVSEWVGIAVAGSIAIAIILGFVLIVVHLGWWQSVAFLVLMLCLSHVIRTLLTGEWSDTSWFGKTLRGLGASPKQDDEE